MQATGKALCFSSQQRCVAFLGTLLGDLLRMWDPLTKENLPTFFRRLLPETDRLFCSQWLVCIYSLMKITDMIFLLPINHFLKFFFISLLVFRGHFIRQSLSAVLGSYLTLSIAPST